MTQLLIAAIGALFLYGAGFATGWKVDAWKHGAEQAAELRAAQDAATDARAVRDRIADDFEKKLSNIRIVNRTINNEVRREVEKTVYGDPNCNVPDSGVRLRNAAIDAANRAVAGESAAAVPADRAGGGGQADVAGRPVPGGHGPDQPVR